MRVRVLLFSELRDLAGRLEDELEVPQGSDPRYLWDQLGKRFPSLGSLAYEVRPAVNETYAEWDTRLEEGDSVAFLAPPGGG